MLCFLIELKRADSINLFVQGTILILKKRIAVWLFLILDWDLRSNLVTGEQMVRYRVRLQHRVSVDAWPADDQGWMVDWGLNCQSQVGDNVATNKEQKMGARPTGNKVI